MKKLIILTIVYLTCLLWVNSLSQVKTEQVTVKKISENVIELRARLFGVFTDLKGKNKNQRTDYLNQNYKVGFLFENFKDLGWEVSNKPMGDHAFRGGAIDTLTIITTITNAELNKDHYCEVYFKPYNQKYKFRTDGTEAIGTKLQDYLCEVQDVTITDRVTTVKNDTVTIVASVSMEDVCSQTLSYQWKYRTYDTATETYSDWLNWTNGRSGAVSMTMNEVKFIVMSNNWDKRQWSLFVSSGVGAGKKSNNFTLRVQ